MKQIKDINIIENASLKKYNTYKIDAIAKYLVEVESIESLVNILKYIKDNNLDYFILGAGSNIILDNYFDGVVIKLTGLNYVKVDDNLVTVGAGTMMPKLAQETINHGLTGLEWTINIPGTVGGSIAGNAGAYNGEMFDDLISVQVLNKDLKIENKKKDEFITFYRHSNIKDLDLIILEGTFLLSKGDKLESKRIVKDRCERRMAAQPLDLPSAGSVFQNPPGDHAGRLIEAAGLKGKKIGDAQVSTKHANFIVNTGNATSNDIKNLIKLVHDTILKDFGIDLILEQEIIDWKK